MNISELEYRQEIKSIAENIKTQGKPDMGLSDRILETLDNHKWVNQAAYNRVIVHNSDNREAYLGMHTQEYLALIKSRLGLTELNRTRAFYAMRQDIINALKI